MLSYVVHYKNKYPGGRVLDSENSIDVYDVDGVHVVALRKNGAGQWVCQSEVYGCRDRHDLSPIPRDSRVFKLAKDGKIQLDELHEERRQKIGSRKKIEAGLELAPEKIEAGLELAPKKIEAGLELAPKKIEAGLKLDPKKIEAGLELLPEKDEK